MTLKAIGACVVIFFTAACTQSNTVEPADMPVPKETVDLGALITEDLPERVWGKRLLAENKFSDPNSFKILGWRQDYGGGTISGSNSYYTLFNHGGPHVDAPNHVGLSGGLDSYAVDQFSGPAKVFDISHFSPGRTVDADFFAGQAINPGDIVLLFTGYSPPRDDRSYPVSISMTRAAALFLAGIPIRAIGTDSQSFYSFQDTRPVEADTPLASAAPIHETFLSRGIPVYEQLFNVDQLLGKRNLFFSGVPLNVRDGDGMIVRPVVFVY